MATKSITDTNITMGNMKFMPRKISKTTLPTGRDMVNGEMAVWISPDGPLAFVYRYGDQTYRSMFEFK